MNVLITWGVSAADETEKGKRALLNLGHTFGHALEALAGYDGSVVHGEAVAVGMILAASYAEREGMLSAADADAIRSGLRGLGLPTRIADLGNNVPAGGARLDWLGLCAGERLTDALLQDKKADSRRLTLVLPTGIGNCEIVKGVDAEKVAAFMRDALRNERDANDS